MDNFKYSNKKSRSQEIGIYYYIKKTKTNT